MPTKFLIEKLSQENLEALEQGLGFFHTFTSADQALQDALLAAASGEGNVWQVFTLLLPDVLIGGSGLEGADRGGWRVAARSGSHVIAADIYTGNTVARTRPYPLAAGTPRLACIRKGEEISNLLTSIQRLTDPPLVDEIPAQTFSLQLLLLPGLVTDSLWLRPQNSAAGPSYIVPYKTLIKGLGARELYTEDQFLQIVRPVAQKWVAFKKQEESRVRRTPGTNKLSQVPALFPRSRAW